MTDEQRAQLDNLARTRTEEALRAVTSALALHAIMKLKATDLEVMDAMCRAADVWRIGMRQQMNKRATASDDTDPAA